MLKFSVAPKQKKGDYSPAINVSKDPLRFGLLVVGSDVRLDPVDNVILESALNHLVKKVHGNEFVDVRPRKTSCEWLTGNDRSVVVRVDLGK
jgi:hypothetical protein